MLTFIRITLASLFLCCIVLVGAEFILSNQLVGMGKEVKFADAGIEKLFEENELLSEKIASASSLLTITERASSLGFSESKRVMTMTHDQFMVAMTQTH